MKETKTIHLTPIVAMLLIIGSPDVSLAWTENVIYSSPTVNVLSVAITAVPQSSPWQAEPFYVVYEVDDGNYRALYLQRWNGPTLWSRIGLDTGLDGLYNPSITSRPGYVSIVAHYNKLEGICPPERWA